MYQLLAKIILCRESRVKALAEATFFLAAFWEIAYFPSVVKEGRWQNAYSFFEHHEGRLSAKHRGHCLPRSCPNIGWLDMANLPSNNRQSVSAVQFLLLSSIGFLYGSLHPKLDSQGVEQPG